MAPTTTCLIPAKFTSDPCPPMSWTCDEPLFQRFISYERQRRTVPFGQAFLGGIVVGAMFALMALFSLWVSGRLTADRLPIVLQLFCGSIVFLQLMSASELIERALRARRLQRAPREISVCSDEVTFAGRTWRWQKLLWPNPVQSLKTRLLVVEDLRILEFEWQIPRTGNTAGMSTHFLRIPIPDSQEQAVKNLLNVEPVSGTPEM